MSALIFQGVVVLVFYKCDLPVAAYESRLQRDNPSRTRTRYGMPEPPAGDAFGFSFGFDRDGVVELERSPDERDGGLPNQDLPRQLEAAENKGGRGKKVELAPNLGELSDRRGTATFLVATHDPARLEPLASRRLALA